MATQPSTTTRSSADSDRVIAAAGTWQVVDEGSDLLFRARKFGLYDVKGRFRQVEGQIEVDEEGVPRRGEVVIQAASITTRMLPRDWHLRTRDYLWAKRYPEIRIEADSVDMDGAGRLTVAATLEIRGKRDRVTLSGEIERLPDQDPSRGLGLHLQGVLDRHRFGVKAPAPLDWIAGQEVKIDARLALRRTS